jgi:hypothetical protein
MWWIKKTKRNRWIEGAERLVEGHDPKSPHEHFLNFVAKELIRPRFIICPGLAVISIADAPSLGNILANSLEPSSEQKRDKKIEEVLTAVLRGNPKANLSAYEEPLGIKILKVKRAKQSSDNSGGIYV